jgi:hypothetical protein
MIFTLCYAHSTFKRAQDLLEKRRRPTGILREE